MRCKARRASSPRSRPAIWAGISSSRRRSKGERFSPPRGGPDCRVQLFPPSIRRRPSQCGRPGSPAPLAAAPSIGSASGKLTAVTASGGMFRLSPADLRAGAKPACAGALRPVRAAQQASLLARAASRGTLCHQRRRRDDVDSRLRSAGAGPLLPLAGDAA